MEPTILILSKIQVMRKKETDINKMELDRIKLTDEYSNLSKGLDTRFTIWW